MKKNLFFLVLLTTAISCLQNEEQSTQVQEQGESYSLSIENCQNITGKGFGLWRNIKEKTIQYGKQIAKVCLENNKITISADCYDQDNNFLISVTDSSPILSFKTDPNNLNAGVINIERTMMANRIVPAGEGVTLNCKVSASSTTLTYLYNDTDDTFQLQAWTMERVTE